MKLQAVGEQENKKAVEMARSSTEGRKMMKQFRSKHKGELNRGDDPRSHDHMLKLKKQKLLEKNGGKFKREKNGPDGKYGDKQWKKIQEKSRPTRSKLIVKRGGANGKGQFKSKGGNSGGGKGGAGKGGAGKGGKKFGGGKRR